MDMMRIRILQKRRVASKLVSSFACGMQHKDPRRAASILVSIIACRSIMLMNAHAAAHGAQGWCNPIMNH